MYLIVPVTSVDSRVLQLDNIEMWAQAKNPVITCPNKKH